MALKTVVIFGVFDGIHNGHNAFINEAKKQGDRLVAIIARDKVVEKLKNKTPKYDELERLDLILNIENVDFAFLGDQEQGVYKVLKEINPDIVFLGYDQKDLYNDLRIKIKKGILPEIELIQGSPHQPDLFHSSILNK